MLALAAGAGGSPAAPGHVGLSAAGGGGADLLADAFPGRAVRRFGAGEGVGDFVEDGVADVVLVVSDDEVVGKLDAFGLIDAQAHAAFAAVEGEGPAGEAVLGHEVSGEGGGIVGVHAECSLSESGGGRAESLCASALWRGADVLLFVAFGIQGILKAVADDVEAEDGEGDGDAGEDGQPPGDLHEVLSVAEHEAP